MSGINDTLKGSFGLLKKKLRDCELSRNWGGSNISKYACSREMTEYSFDDCFVTSESLLFAVKSKCVNSQ